MAVLPKAFWPLTITAGVNDKINFWRAATGNLTATIAPGTYLSAEDLRAAVEAAMDAVDTGWSVSCNAPGNPGKIGFHQSVTCSLLFATGANAATSARDVLGFGAVDRTGSAFYFGANQHQNAWYADRSLAFDGRERFTRTLGVTVALAGPVKTIVHAEAEHRTIRFGMLPAYKTKVSREGASTRNEALERLWRGAVLAGRFRWWPNGDGTYQAELDFVDYALDEASAKDFNPVRLGAKELYSVEWLLRRYV
jgi:hypothetical protein